MSAEILAKQNEFFRAMASRADLALTQQATISRRACLNFIADVKDFCEQFVTLNNATIIEMQKEITDDIRDDTTGEPATAGDPNASTGASAGLREENNRPDMGSDVPGEAGLQADDAGSKRVRDGSGKRKSRKPQRADD